MLSAICLVNYFEGGQLPKDRAVLYRLCVEGLLHHWDQRRGIHSEFGLEEKLRACREVALAMQADDRAEYEADRVQTIFTGVLGDSARAEKLLEHIRYRTGLLLERRASIFAFAHLTFQEYLAARAVHEGNRLGINTERLAREHDDGRWNEVSALYCGLAPTPAVRDMIEGLIAQPDTRSLSMVLAEAYLSTSPELSQDSKLRHRVLERISLAPSETSSEALDRFSPDDVAPIANLFVGKIKSDLAISESHDWLCDHPERLDTARLSERLRDWRTMNPFEIAELIHLVHTYGLDAELAEVAFGDVYAAPGPNFAGGVAYNSQAEIALLGMAFRVQGARSSRESKAPLSSPGADAAFLQILRVLSVSKNIGDAHAVAFSAAGFLARRNKAGLPQDATVWPEFASLARRLAGHLPEIKEEGEERGRIRKHQDRAIKALNSWAELLEHAIAAGMKKRTTPKAASRRMAKKKVERR